MTYSTQPWPSRPGLAVYSGTCPVCARYIRKNHSPVELLPSPGLSLLVERTVDPGGATWYTAGGRTWVRGEEPHDLFKPRRAVHKKCHPEALRRLGEGSLSSQLDPGPLTPAKISQALELLKKHEAENE